MKNQQRLRTIAKVVALVLAALMVLGTLSAGLVALAAPVAVGGTVLPKQEILFQSRTITKDQHYIVSKGGDLLIEKGVTLTIVGSLEVVGTLKNEGTIVVTGSFQRAENAVDGSKEGHYNVGNLSNRGEIYNRGRIHAATGSITNYPRATFYNEKLLQLSNLEDHGTLFYNMSLRRGDEGQYLDQGVLNNTGRIEIDNQQGRGLVNQREAVVNNDDGIIVLGEKGTCYGNISGKAPITQKEYQALLLQEKKA